MDLDGFQRRIAETYLDREAGRGVAATVAWLAEELGELAQAERKGTPAQHLHELGDEFLWHSWSTASSLDGRQGGRSVLDHRPAMAERRRQRCVSALRMSTTRARP